jgi:hypothetical protein
MRFRNPIKETRDTVEGFAGIAVLALVIAGYALYFSITGLERGNANR